MTQPVDSSILHEIVRIVESRRKVPGHVRVRAREYQITYLEDHQRRLEEALRRYDADQLNMLYGQLASKIKYQALRRVPERARTPARARPRAKKEPGSPAKKRASHPPARQKKQRALTVKKGGAPSGKVAASRTKSGTATTKRVAPAKKAAAKRSDGRKKRTPARKR